MATKLSLDLPLIGPGGEPVNLRRTLIGHGVTTLAPAQVDEANAIFDITLPFPEYGVRAMRIESGNPGFARVTGWDVPDTPEARAELEQAARWLMRMETDLSPLYDAARNDPDLAWITIGAGRMGRCNTVFEDVIKTVLTTNCAWSATIRMVTALVQNLGEPAPIVEGFTPHRAFPTPEAMASQDEAFYREVIRAGYRAKPLRAIAEMVASGAIDLERMALASPDEPAGRGHARRVAGAAWHRAVRRRARYDDDRSTIPLDSRFVDPAEVREANRQHGKRRRNRSAFRALWRLCRTRFLALCDPRLVSGGIMTTTTSMSARVREMAEPIWQAQFDHPFVRGLGDGTLPFETFGNWLRQDYVYLIEYGRLFAYAAGRAPDLATMNVFAKLLYDMTDGEMALHKSYTAEFGITVQELEQVEKWPTCQGYTDFLLRTATVGDYPELIAALLPACGDTAISAFTSSIRVCLRKSVTPVGLPPMPPRSSPI